jgi:hypothetical protein
MILPNDIKEVLVGTILGDARMNFVSFNNAGFYFEQVMKHKEYLYYLFGMLVMYANNSEPVHRKYVDSRTGKQGESYWFSLKYSPMFGIFAQLFYKPIENGSGYVKVIPWACMYELLTPRALAFWIMDDGQYVTRGGVTLCTDNYSFEDVFTLMLVLEMKLGLICTMQTKRYSNRSKTYYRIYISKASLPLLRSLVSEHMHPSMMYKLDN